MSDQTELASIKRAAVAGIAWTGIESALRQVIQVVANLALARLLFPADFGIIGMALIFQGVAQLLADFGIGAAVVQRRELAPDALSSAFWANLAVSFAITVVMYLSAPYVGAFYSNPDVVAVIQVLSLSLLLGGLRTLPRTLLYKEMLFSKLSRIGIVSSFCGAFVSVSMAATGFGVWSLVAQPIVGNVVELALLWKAQKWRPDWTFKWSSMRDLAQFSYGVLGTNLLNYAARNTDNLLIGRYLGSEPLGYYALAYQVMLYPLSQVSGVIVKVLFPTLSKLQNEPEQIRAAFLAGVSMIAFVAFPMMNGLLAVSHDFIVVVFGEKWLPMELVLQVFCVIGLLQSVGTTVGIIYMTTGQTRLMLRVTLYATPVVIASFAVGLPWGIEGVAISYGCVTIVLFFVLARIALGLIDMRLGEMFTAVRGPLFASLIMLACTVATVRTLPIEVPMVRLGIAIAVGCTSYVLATLLCNRAQVRRLFALYQSTVRQSNVT